MEGSGGPGAGVTPGGPEGRTRPPGGAGGVGGAGETPFETGAGEADVSDCDGDRGAPEEGESGDAGGTGASSGDGVGEAAHAASVTAHAMERTAGRAKAKRGFMGDSFFRVPAVLAMGKERRSTGGLTLRVGDPGPEDPTPPKAVFASEEQEGGATSRGLAYPLAHHAGASRVLMGRGRIAIGEADLLWEVAFARGLWCSVFTQHGLVVDTRYVAPSVDPPRPAACLYLVLDGALTTHGEHGRTFEAPAAIVVSDDQLDGSGGVRSFTFTAVGNPYTAIELHLETTDLAVKPDNPPPQIHLDADAWAAARAVVGHAGPDDDAFQSALAALLERLVRAGLLAPSAAARVLEPTPKAFALLWRALRPMVERLYLTPTLKEVSGVTGLSTRQVDRYVHDFVASFAMAGEGWRPATRYLRLKFAAIFLSAEGATVADVARAVGYRSSDAMARAFRDAKMLPPAQLQSKVRARGGD